jgi:hypothetical protein
MIEHSIDTTMFESGDDKTLADLMKAKFNLIRRNLDAIVKNGKMLVY